MENLNISCSPGTFTRVVSDEKYRKEVADQVLAEHTEYSSVVFSQTDAQTIEELVEKGNPSEIVEGIDAAEYVEAIFTPLGKPVESQQYWSEGATKLMLASIEELLPKVGKSMTVKTRAKMYSIVSERMDRENYTFSPTQIEYKFRALERQYKKTVLNNRRTGRNRHTCQYEKELADILGKKKGINPEIVLESADVAGKSHNGSMEDSCSDLEQSLSDNIPSCSSQAPKWRKTGAADAILLEISKIRENKEDFHTKLLEMLEKKEDERAKEKLEKEKEKKERAEKRDQREEIKLKLLQKLVEQNNSNNNK